MKVEWDCFVGLVFLLVSFEVCPCWYCFLFLPPSVGIGAYLVSRVRVDSYVVSPK